MRPLLFLAATAALAACGGDGGTKPKGPVTFVPVGFTYADGAGTHNATGTVTVDGQVLHIGQDSIAGLTRGEHQIITKLDIEYLADTFAITIDPSGNRFVDEVSFAGSCRDNSTDARFCTGRNTVTATASRRLLCRVNDFGDFCTGYADPQRIGLRWPVDSAASQNNGYITTAKLLVGARPSAAIPATANDTMAMSLFLPGDYGPRARLRTLSADSTRWQTLVWTDLRQQPFFGKDATLDFDDRNLDVFGLQVRTTYQLSAARKDVLLIRYDVTNISADADWRTLHVGFPVGGITLRDVFLAPVLDPDIGHTFPVSGPELEDDNATLFPADSLLAAYDQEFSVLNFGTGTTARPGLVGLRLVSADAPAKALIVDIDDPLDFASPAIEHNTYRLLAAGRAGAADAANACVDRGSAYVCAPESPINVIMGWSVGPFATIAPGQTVSLTVALVMAYPKAGEFTTGTSVAPQNDQLGATTTRPIWRIAEPLRTLANQVAGATVSPTR